MAGAHEMSKGVTAAGAPPLTIAFDGRSITTMTGQSVLAALVGAGEKAFRTTAGGARRGMFCGMGVCQECIVDIDGGGSRPACLVTVREGMVVTPLPPRPEPTPVAAAPTTTELAPDLLVIGGGPGGLAAAAVAAESGLEVVLIDERAKLGGQFYKQPADGFRTDDSRVDKQFRNGRALIQRALTAGVRHLPGTTVWAAFGAGEFLAGSPTSSYAIRPKRVVLATGAYERGVPLPGWTLPGFMTTGAAQTLLRSYQLAPGKRVLLGGNGPLNLQVAAELVRAGVEVVALVEAARRPGAHALGSLATMAAIAPDLVRNGIAYGLELRRAGVPTFYGSAIVRAEGAGAVESVVVAEIDEGGHPVARTEKTFAVDAACVGFGFLPSNEIARALGCRHRFDERRGHLTAERDERCRSSVPHVWIVGDAGGLGGARMAEASGIVAGADVARELGHEIGKDDEISASVRTIVRAGRFQDALWALFKAPRLIDQLAQPDTIVCRCEEITLAAIRESIDQGMATAGAVKRASRAGMGRCQGRYCGSIVVELVARQHSAAIDEFAFFAPRLPFKPTPLASVAGRQS